MDDEARLLFLFFFTVGTDTQTSGYETRRIETVGAFLLSNSFIPSRFRAALVPSHSSSRRMNDSFATLRRAGSREGGCSAAVKPRRMDRAKSRRALRTLPRYVSVRRGRTDGRTDGKTSRRRRKKEGRERERERKRGTERDGRLGPKGEKETCLADPHRTPGPGYDCDPSPPLL